jgi:hypothetical protein
VIIEEDPYATKEELEAIEAQLWSDELIKQRVIASREPPPILTLPLLPYQKEFLAWAIDQELSPIRGGVLAGAKACRAPFSLLRKGQLLGASRLPPDSTVPVADEMGMGKTLQAVSLIVTHPQEGQILGPEDGTPAAVSTEEAPAPKMRLRMPSVLPQQGGQKTGGSTCHDVPAGCAGAEDAQQLPTSENGCHSHARNAEPQQCVTKTPATKSKANGKGRVKAKAADTTPATPGPSTSKASTSKASTGGSPDEGRKSDAEGNKGMPEGKDKGKGKEKKKRVDPLVAAMQQAKDCRAEPEEGGDDGFCRATLVVCPVVAAMQWRQEILRYTGAGGHPAARGLLQCTPFSDLCRIGCIANSGSRAVLLPLHSRCSSAHAQAHSSLVHSSSAHSSSAHSSSAHASLSACNLVRAHAGALNVLLYHGTNRGESFSKEQLEAADVVLTSYSIMEVDYRRNIMAPKATCKYCGRKFQPERLKVHLRYFCGPYAHKTEAQAKQQKKRALWLVGGEGGKARCWHLLHASGMHTMAPCVVTAHAPCSGRM